MVKSDKKQPKTEKTLKKGQKGGCTFINIVYSKAE